MLRTERRRGIYRAVLFFFCIKSYFRISNFLFTTDRVSNDYSPSSLLTLFIPYTSLLGDLLKLVIRHYLQQKRTFLFQLQSQQSRGPYLASAGDIVSRYGNKVFRGIRRRFVPRSCHYSSRPGPRHPSYGVGCSVRSSARVRTRAPAHSG